MKAALKSITLKGNSHLSLSGYYHRQENNTGVYDDIQINLCLIENNNQQTLLVSMDSIGIDSKTTKEIKQRLFKACSIKESSVFLYATHTHSSYKAMRQQSTPLLNVILNDQKHNEHEKLFHQTMIDSIVKATQQCQQHLETVEFSYSKSKVESVATNRNNKEQAIDNRLDVIKIKNYKQIVGCICVFACHPTILDSTNLKVSSDYVGSIRKAINQVYPNCTTLFLQGCAAEVSTRYTRKESSYQECQRIGGIIGKEVVNCLKQETQISSKLTTKVLPIQFQVRDFKERVVSKMVSPTNRKQEVIQQGQMFQDLFLESKTSETIDSEVSLIDFGYFRICNLPGEPDGKIGSDIQKTMGENTIVCGYCNDYVGYLVSQEGLQQTYEKQMMLFTANTHELIVGTFKLG